MLKVMFKLLFVLSITHTDVQKRVSLNVIPWDSFYLSGLRFTHGLFGIVGLGIISGTITLNVLVHV